MDVQWTKYHYRLSRIDLRADFELLEKEWKCSQVLEATVGQQDDFYF